MVAEVIDPQDPQWRAFLERVPHDVYHLPEYVEFCARQEGGRPLAFYAETEDGTLLVPLIMDALPAHLGAPPDWCDARTPYGYPAPLITAHGSSPPLEGALEAFRSVGRAMGVVTAFFRLHPLLPLPAGPLEKNGLVVQHGETVHLDLGWSVEESRRHMRKGHRTEIRRLQERGFSACIGAWDRYGEFMALYRANMVRVGAADFYLFPDNYFMDLREALGASLHLIEVLSPDGNTACAALFMETDGIVQYHLSATHEDYFRAAPTKLMIHFASHWFRDRGNRVLHLGGGVGAQADSLFQFKSGFSKLRSPFYTYRLVLDEPHYAKLKQRWQELAGLPCPSDDGFFPVYRRPLG